MHVKIGLRIQVNNGIYKIIGLKIDRLRTDTSAHGKCKATADAATGGNEISSLFAHDRKIRFHSKIQNCMQIKIYAAWRSPSANGTIELIAKMRIIFHPSTASSSGVYHDLSRILPNEERNENENKRKERNAACICMPLAARSTH